MEITLNKLLLLDEFTIKGEVTQTVVISVLTNWSKYWKKYQNIHLKLKENTKHKQNQAGNLCWLRSGKLKTAVQRTNIEICTLQCRRILLCDRFELSTDPR